MNTAIEAYAGPVVVSALYLLLYYIFMVRVGVLKYRLDAQYRARGEKFDRYFGQDRQMLAMDRIQLNMLEHMPPFLALLWLHAVFVSPRGATIAGAVYLATRAAYPLVLGARLGRNVRPNIIWVTGPGYVVILYFVVALLWAALG